MSAGRYYLDAEDRIERFKRAAEYYYSGTADVFLHQRNSLPFGIIANAELDSVYFRSEDEGPESFVAVQTAAHTTSA